MNLLFLGASRTNPACRFRMLQFIPYLERLGHSVRYDTPHPELAWRSPLTHPRALYWGYTYAIWWMRERRLARMLSGAGAFDAVLVNRDLLPNLRDASMERHLAGANPRLVFDFDDAIYLNSPPEKIAEICRLAAWVTPGNETLAGFAREHNRNVTIIPTVVDTDRVRPSQQRAEGPIRVGWTGSDESYAHTVLEPFRSAMLPVLRTWGAELVVVKESPPSPEDWPGLCVRFVHWSPETEVSALREMDIGIMPLTESPFQRGKCGAKLVQYMAAGLPTLASPVGANRDIVLDGVTGFLPATPCEWGASFELLAGDPDLRARLGGAGRMRCEKEYSVAAVLPRLLDIFGKVNPA